MSAAEPADPTRAHVLNAGATAAVVPLSKHRRRGGLTAVRGWRDTMATTSGPGPNNEPDPRPPVSQATAEFAETIEISMLEIGRSLTEPATADVFQRTLDLARLALEGSHATGIITAEQLDELAAIIDGMKQAPRLV
ncbi:hypothetical protein [Streptomyces longwoodensis]|uniref:hypothetical protein n=1 Tax=Streptomyces longwoodensis TaxID=68231 RepID=UPI00225BC332|nr:hypothetical protein [Streptomyces longwoodensis]MCX5000937.1 hypothetical protein [Streptomyces longwoodensis]